MEIASENCMESRKTASKKKEVTYRMPNKIVDKQRTTNNRGRGKLEIMGWKRIGQKLLKTSVSLFYLFIYSTNWLTPTYRLIFD